MAGAVVVAEGCRFTGGCCAVRWFNRSSTPLRIYESIAEVEEAANLDRGSISWLGTVSYPYDWITARA